MFNKREIVCLCGSTSFALKFRETNLALTLAEKIVLSLGSESSADDNQKEFKNLSLCERRKIIAKLQLLHLSKIDICDKVLIINEFGYIGESVALEIAYAQEIKKPILYQWWSDNVPECHFKQYDKEHRHFEILGLSEPQNVNWIPWIDGDKPVKKD